VSIHLTREASDDIDRLWFQSAADFGVPRAEARLKRIYSTLRETIGVFPASGRLRPEFGRGVRSFPVLPHVLFYRVEGRRVTILRVLHSRRDLNGPLMSLMLSA